MQNRVMHRLRRWESAVTNFLLLLSGILIMLIAWLQTYGVVKRYAFHAPDPVAYEFSMMFLLFCGVLAVAGVEKLDQNVRNDIVASRFSPKLRIVLLKIVFPIMSLVFCAVLIWKSLDDAIYAAQIGQVTQSVWALPLGPIKSFIPFGYILLTFVLIGEIIQGIMLLMGKNTEEQPEEQTEQQSAAGN